MATSNHNFENRTGERAFRTLFVLASKYATGAKRGQVGDCQPPAPPIDQGRVYFLPVAGTLIDSAIKGAMIFQPITGTVDANGYEFEDKSTGELGPDDGAMIFQPITGTVDANGYEFEDKSTGELGPDDGAMIFQPITGTLDANA